MKTIPESTVLAAYIGMTMVTTPEMDALQQAVADENTVIDSVIVFLDGLGSMIAASAGDKAASLALANDVAAKKQALADAVVRNTPAAP